ncbi:MAG: PilN domain-containing protein [Gammaproteobacteria bacterium]|nr:PilN domain-containing protein [Gammaproteobacteria bacterium]
MIKINLLPWREQARRAKKIRFAIFLGIFLVLTFVMLIFVHMYVSGWITAQQQRSAYLQSEIDASQLVLTDLKSQKNKESALTSQLNFVMDLRAKGFRAIGLLTALVKAVPQSLSIDKILRRGNTVYIGGRAESDLEITLFMKNLGTEGSFNPPVLTEITTQQSGLIKERHFQMKIEQQELK